MEGLHLCSDWKTIGTIVAMVIRPGRLRDLTGLLPRSCVFLHKVTQGRYDSNKASSTTNTASVHDTCGTKTQASPNTVKYQISCAESILLIHISCPNISITSEMLGDCSLPVIDALRK